MCPSWTPRRCGSTIDAYLLSFGEPLPTGETQRVRTLVRCLDTEMRTKYVPAYVLPQVQQVATQAELEQVISNSDDALVVIDFTATWCGPCQKISPVFELLSQELTDVVFLKIDVDENEVRGVTGTEV